MPLLLHLYVKCNLKHWYAEVLECCSHWITPTSWNQFLQICDSGLIDYCPLSSWWLARRTLPWRVNLQTTLLWSGQFRLSGSGCWRWNYSHGFRRPIILFSAISVLPRMLKITHTQMYSQTDALQLAEIASLRNGVVYKGTPTLHGARLSTMTVRITKVRSSKLWNIVWAEWITRKHKKILSCSSVTL